MSRPQADTAVPLKGLTGLYGDPQDTIDLMDEGVLEAKANPIHPDHGDYGSQAQGYSGTVPLQSPFSDLAVYDAGTDGDYGGMGEPPEGQAMDQTPGIHAGPYPRGIQQMSWADPDGYALVGEQMMALHQPDLGGPSLYVGRAPAGHEEVTHYSTDLYDSPDQVMLARIPNQIKGSGAHAGGAGSGHGSGSADVSQGYGVANTMSEFSHGRSMRRVQHDRMPMDWTNTHGEQDTPFYGRHPVQQMPLDGPDSPYFAMGSIDGGQTPWEGRIGDPTAYVQPPEVTVAPARASQSEDVWAWS